MTNEMTKKTIKTTFDRENMSLTRKLVISESPRNGSGKPVVKSEEVFLSYKLREVTLMELKELRKSGIPGMVYKLGTRLWYTPISKGDRFFETDDFIGKHLCSFGGSVCTHLSAARDEDGGCEKVRKRSSRIERFPFVSEGYETFNTTFCCFVVLKCKNFEPCQPRKFQMFESKQAVERLDSLYDLFNTKLTI